MKRQMIYVTVLADTFTLGVLIHQVKNRSNS